MSLIMLCGVVQQDELRTEMRKKSLLSLIYHHLLGQGSVWCHTDMSSYFLYWNHSSSAHIHACVDMESNICIKINSENKLTCVGFMCLCPTATWQQHWPWTRKQMEGWGSLRFAITSIWRWCWWSMRVITMSSSRNIPNLSKGQQKQVHDHH